MEDYKEMVERKAGRVIELFADATGCEAQYNQCPCNSCFHSMSSEIDYQHIVWLLLLYFRGDYEEEDIIPSIRKELSKRR